MPSLRETSLERWRKEVFEFQKCSIRDLGGGGRCRCVLEEREKGALQASTEGEGDEEIFIAFVWRGKEDISYVARTGYDEELKCYLRRLFRNAVMTRSKFRSKKIFYSKTEGHVLTHFLTHVKINGDVQEEWPIWKEPNVRRIRVSR